METPCICGRPKGERKFCSAACRNRSRTRPLAQRFWDHVSKGEGEACWIWTGATINSGYGKFSIRRSQCDPAHRVAWRITHGEIPPGLHVCHRCDVRLCVRPDHLFLGTAKENIGDAIQKGRMVKVRASSGQFIKAG